MDHVGLPVEMFQQRECGAREEGEANVVVLVAVDVGTSEELRRVHEVHGCAGRFAAQKSDGMHAPAPFNGNVLDDFIIQQPAIDLHVMRNYDARMEAVTSKPLRSCG